MNFVGHAVVAARVPPASPGFLLGAVLPDLLPMAGVRRLDPAAGLPDDVAAGMRCHILTDASFHAHAGFVGLLREVRSRLLARGVPTGPARAAAHVGVELALDGLLLDRADGQDALAAALSDRQCVTFAIPAEARARWDDLTARIADRGALHPYRDPAPVVQRVLARRPRLALDDEHVAVLAAELEAVAPALAAAEADLVADAVSAASAGGTPVASPRPA